MNTRLPTHLEVAGIVRRVQTNGGFATVMRKGDADSGALLLIVSSRGRHVACLERILGAAGGYDWKAVGPSESAGSIEIGRFLADRARFDEDYWAIELDVADAERFIAETSASA